LCSWYITLGCAAGPIAGDAAEGSGLPELQLGFVTWLMAHGHGGPGTPLRLGPRVALASRRQGGSRLQHCQQKAYCCCLQPLPRLLWRRTCKGTGVGLATQYRGVLRLFSGLQFLCSGLAATPRCRVSWGPLSVLVAV